MVGPQAAGDFVAMIQHQPAAFRQEALPQLKANVAKGEADPESYAIVTTARNGTWARSNSMESNWSATPEKRYMKLPSKMRHW
jgi:hypothetical protein